PSAVSWFLSSGGVPDSARGLRTERSARPRRCIRFSSSSKPLEDSVTMLSPLPLSPFYIRSWLDGAAPQDPVEGSAQMAAATVTIGIPLILYGAEHGERTIGWCALR